MELLDYASKYIEETQFFNDQKKLDTMYYLTKGLTYREIAEEIGKDVTYVQRVMYYLRDNGYLNWGRWAPNVYRIGMEKSIVFLDGDDSVLKDWKNSELPTKEKKNFKYTTYVHYVLKENLKLMIVYTYPKEEKSKIEGTPGELITPFYYTYTRFTVPFFKRIDLVREFNDLLSSMDNDERILSGTPSFGPVEPDKIDDHPITVYICRCGGLQLESGLKPGIIMEYLKQDFKTRSRDDFRNLEDIGITYEEVRTRLKKIKEKGIIFPMNELYLRPLSYQSVLVRIKANEIYKIMGTLNQFNMLTRVAQTKKEKIYYLHIQYPFFQFPDVMEILSQHGEIYETYIETKFVDSDTIVYRWSLEKFLDLQSKKC